MKRGRIELFRPYRATTAKSIPYPGRRSAAIAAALCPGLVCQCPFGAEEAWMTMHVPLDGMELHRGNAERCQL